MVVVDFWLWSLTTDAAEDARLSAHLSPDEAARADRFVDPAHGVAYRAGRGRMREVLAGYLSQLPSELAFTYNPQGKPSLPNGPAFNLSHAGGFAALGVVPTGERIGVDIEAFRAVEDGVAQRFFAAAEYSELSDLPEDQWAAGFFRCWTRKEAIVKGYGPGLSMSLSDFEVSLRPEDPAELRVMAGQDPHDWKMVHLDLGGQSVGAIAVESFGRDIQVVPKGPIWPRGIG